ncbi:putative methionyl-tRNA synthetase [Talaromyces proteolyticus]|uniref:Probable methionine--tRNA ligase, mitochondrial n=1 Tax=Talaromyces proteolyticus TaxID=1131652 RepID=A0AAD4KKB9_9EURO|nr:putative methionyl-tRNA synthetase [Talaromyces proteolyticus]KAH8693702.1 putative methionyl-tRNA synthetase [Talaromyces proteolyticus]
MGHLRPALSWASAYRNTKTPFTCVSCLSHTYKQRRFPSRTHATQAHPKKPYYVTTPIFYVNAAPHVGHLFTMVTADVLKRWQLLLGNTDAQLLTGTDEHGMKIQRAAQEAGMDTQEFCDMNCQTFKDLAKAANLKHDHFIRTTDDAHKDAVRYFWEMLRHRGYIYTAKHEGWYCVSDETFYPQSQVQASLDPATGRKIMTSVETGKEVEWSTETNYHFRLSAFRDRLLEFYKENVDWVSPSPYYRDLYSSIESGLQDLSISRPVERLSWGIRVPGDETQTIYVWLDALVNYLTKAGYPFTPGKESDLGWPADVQVVGKDIMRFHCVYWPAFLMALDLPLPRKVLVHGHWTMNREKMSKSTGNVVNPFFAINRFDVDTIRFFLTMQGPLVSDSDYDNDYIVRDYKKYLQDGLGNLMSRTMGVAKWKPRVSIDAAAAGSLPAPTDLDKVIEEALHITPSRTKMHMDLLKPRAALREVIWLIQGAQKYLHLSAPWQYKEDPQQAQRIVYNVCESLRIAGILLSPFMPQKSAEILDFLRVGTDVSKRNFEAATYGADFEYGEVEKTSKLLFPPLLIEN